MAKEWLSRKEEKEEKVVVKTKKGKSFSFFFC